MMLKPRLSTHKYPSHLSHAHVTCMTYTSTFVGWATVLESTLSTNHMHSYTGILLSALYHRQTSLTEHALDLVNNGSLLSV